MEIYGIYRKTERGAKKQKKTIDKLPVIGYYITRAARERGGLGEHSSAGRAFALQAKGHRFEPCCSHHDMAR